MSAITLYMWPYLMAQGSHIRQCAPRRHALSVGQENKFVDSFSGVCGAVILDLFKYDILAAICIMKSSFFQLCAKNHKEVSRCLWTCTFWPGDIYGSRETKNEFIYFYFLAENWQSYIRNAYILGIFESHFWKPHKWFEFNSYIENLYGFS